MNIDYNNITDFSRSSEELTAFLMWCTVTPGKRSDVITPKFNSMFTDKDTPTKLIRAHGKTVRAALEKAGIGQYDRISKCWKQVSKIIKPKNLLADITRDDLIKIDGIGPKTASFFVAHSQPWSEVAVLDTHILQYLQQKFPKYPVPSATPQDLDEYKRLEYMFLGIACSKDMEPHELDTQIWKERTHPQTTKQL